MGGNSSVVALVSCPIYPSHRQNSQCQPAQDQTTLEPAIQEFFIRPPGKRAEHFAWSRKVQLNAGFQAGKAELQLRFVN